MIRSGFSMNLDITPSSPHPPRKAVDTATTVAKTFLITIWQSGSGRTAGDDSTLSRPGSGSPPRSGVRVGRSGMRAATSPLPCLSAKVPSPPDLQTFAIVR